MSLPTPDGTIQAELADPETLAAAENIKADFISEEGGIDRAVSYLILPVTFSHAGSFFTYFPMSRTIVYHDGPPQT